jgi:hypothetical protein
MFVHGTNGCPFPLSKRRKKKKKGVLQRNGKGRGAMHISPGKETLCSSLGSRLWNLILSLGSRATGVPSLFLWKKKGFDGFTPIPGKQG